MLFLRWKSIADDYYDDDCAITPTDRNYPNPENPLEFGHAKVMLLIDRNERPDLSLSPFAFEKNRTSLIPCLCPSPLSLVWRPMEDSGIVTNSPR